MNTCSSELTLILTLPLIYLKVLNHVSVLQLFEVRECFRKTKVLLVHLEGSEIHSLVLDAFQVHSALIQNARLQC